MTEERKFVAEIRDLLKSGIPLSNVIYNDAAESIVDVAHLIQLARDIEQQVSAEHFECVFRYALFLRFPELREHIIL